MFDGIHDSRSQAGPAAARRPADPLLKAIAIDLLVATGGFLLMVTAVVLAARGLSPT